MSSNDVWSSWSHSQLSFEGSSNFFSKCQLPLLRNWRNIYFRLNWGNYEVWLYQKWLSRWKSILDVGYCKKLSQPLCLEADRQAAHSWRQLIYILHQTKTNLRKTTWQKQYDKYSMTKTAWQRQHDKDKHKHKDKDNDRQAAGRSS